MKTDVKSEIEGLKGLLVEANARIAKLEEQADAPASWPEIDEVYHYINSGGGVASDVWDNTALALARAAIGNVFRTEADARQEIERRKVLTDLRDLARKSWDANCIRWQSGQNNWRLVYSRNSDTWLANGNVRDQNLGAIYFATEEDALAAVETIGAARLNILLDWV